MKYEEIKARVTALHPSIPVFPATVALARRVFVDDLTDDTTFLRFTREIHWVRLVEAMVQLRKGAKLIRNDASFLDTPFCGSLLRALNGARETAKALDLTPASEMQAVVTASVRDVPMLALTGSMEGFKERFESREQKLALPEHFWLYDDAAALEACARARRGTMEDRLAVTWPWVSDRTVVASQVVWSSGRVTDVEMDGERWVAQWATALQAPTPDLRTLLPAR